MGAIAIPTLIKDAPWILCGVLALVCAVFFGLWQHEKAAFAEDKVAQADAIKKAHDKAEALSNELVIAQAQAMGVQETVRTEYVDRIKTIPVKPGEDEGARTERMRAGTLGVRAQLCGGRAEAFCVPAAGQLPATSAGAR